MNCILIDPTDQSMMDYQEQYIDMFVLERLLDAEYPISFTYNTAQGHQLVVAMSSSIELGRVDACRLDFGDNKNNVFAGPILLFGAKRVSEAVTNLVSSPLSIEDLKKIITWIPRSEVIDNL